MEKRIVVNAGARESRVALLEDGKLAELKVDREQSIVGNVYLSKVENVVPGLDAAFVNIGLDRNAFLYVADALPEDPPPRMRRGEGLPPIGKVVKQGQQLLVQVTKGPIGRKGARVTSRISLPGRYTVLMAQSGKAVGVSHKIEDASERERLRKTAAKLRPPEFGLIVRTRAEGASSADLARDVRFLRRVWRGLKEKAEKARPPALVHEDLGPVFTVIRDVFSPDIEELVVDDPEMCKRVVALVQAIAPQLRRRIRQYDQPGPIFEHYGVTEEIERALRPRVRLEHGGSIVIEETEALTVIDVNTGKYTGARRLADTVLQTNIDAVDEIARQLRLRDIGGIIVVDFIDMENRRHRNEVMRALRARFKEDRVRTRILHLTPLGLVEMTRKRTGESLADLLSGVCPTCEGRGHLLSPDSVAVQVETQLQKVLAGGKPEAVLVTAHPRVALALIGEHGEMADRLEKRFRVPIYVRSDDAMHPERFRIEPGKKRMIERQFLPFKAGQTLEILPRHILPQQQERHLVAIQGYTVEVSEVLPPGADLHKVRLDQVHHSWALASLVYSAGNGNERE